MVLPREEMSLAEPQKSRGHEPDGVPNTTQALEDLCLANHPSDRRHCAGPGLNSGHTDGSRAQGTHHPVFPEHQAEASISEASRSLPEQVKVQEPPRRAILSLGAARLYTLLWPGRGPGYGPKGLSPNPTPITC